MPSRAPSVLPSGSPLRSAGILYATQWTKGFWVGASGSSQMIAISLVPWGSEPHRRGGETSSPSPVCLFGMVAPDSKTGLDTSMVTAPPSHELLYKQIRELDPELKLHGGA